MAAATPQAALVLFPPRLGLRRTDEEQPEEEDGDYEDVTRCEH
jgi:hypothetical protein